ncbi:MAG: DUF3782 domain-containing protein [Candidatus Caldarchaeum sp.]|nr:DUF3782 domain-containing protein [Candidatus Caldarchaeum sp.]
MSESAFREGLVLEKELELAVEKWTSYDDYVYGYPSPVDVDVTVRDGATILIEVKSRARRSDVMDSAGK